MPHLEENIRQQLTKVLVQLSAKTQDALNGTIPYLPDRTKANLIRLALGLGIPSIALVAWYYRRQMQHRPRQQQQMTDNLVLEEHHLLEQRTEEQRLKEQLLEQRLQAQLSQHAQLLDMKNRKHPPSPIIIPLHSTATIDLAKITPPHQISKLDNAPLGMYTPRNAPLTSPWLEHTYNTILRRDLCINPDDFEPHEDDPYYDMLRHLTPVQRALLATLNDEHQRKVLWGLDDDWYGSVWAKGGDGRSDGVGVGMEDGEFKQMILRRAV